MDDDYGDLRIVWQIWRAWVVRSLNYCTLFESLRQGHIVFGNYQSGAISLLIPLSLSNHPGLIAYLRLSIGYYIKLSLTSPTRPSLRNAPLSTQWSSLSSVPGTSRVILSKVSIWHHHSLVPDCALHGNVHLWHVTWAGGRGYEATL